MARVTFTVPATAGQYAPEADDIGISANADIGHRPLLGVTSFFESAPAGAAIEVWLPKRGAARPALDADFFYFATLATGAGGDTKALAHYPGARIRVKSGGTAGTAIVNTSHD